MNNDKDEKCAKYEMKMAAHLPILYGTPKATPLKAEPTTLHIPHEFHLQSVGPLVPMSHMH
jgi:hypothetical protein